MQQIVVAYEARMKLINDTLGAIFGKSKREPESLVDSTDGRAVSGMMQDIMRNHDKTKRASRRNPDGSITTGGAQP